MADAVYTGLLIAVLGAVAATALVMVVRLIRGRG